MEKFGVIKYSSLTQLLSDSDFVSIHSVLNAETEKLIGEKELRAMKSSAIIINSARGAIIDEHALVKAITEGWIAGAGLDVFSEEPLNQSNHPLKELYGRANVILMPHLTFYTDGAMDRLETETLERCFEILEGKDVLVKSLDPRLLKQRRFIIFQ
jgi:D-3-phosphoglycerate dehydrogenase